MIKDIKNFKYLFLLFLLLNNPSETMFKNLFQGGSDIRHNNGVTSLPKETKKNQNNTPPKNPKKLSQKVPETKESKKEVEMEKPQSRIKKYIYSLKKSSVIDTIADRIHKKNPQTLEITVNNLGIPEIKNCRTFYDDNSVLNIIIDNNKFKIQGVEFYNNLCNSLEKYFNSIKQEYNFCNIIVTGEHTELIIEKVKQVVSKSCPNFKTFIFRENNLYPYSDSGSDSENDPDPINFANVNNRVPNNVSSMMKKEYNIYLQKKKTTLPFSKDVSYVLSNLCFSVFPYKLNNTNLSFVVFTNNNTKKEKNNERFKIENISPFVSTQRNYNKIVYTENQDKPQDKPQDNPKDNNKLLSTTPNDCVDVVNYN
ncbi:hypothetical protein AB836_01725 [Rickettsiales bacterium (ex Bugula neritina AB1)]|nr:hypothetical protein AB836_01725 [Rickettsiales bacterium (ex Bugula neritina AB1)]